MSWLGRSRSTKPDGAEFGPAPRPRFPLRTAVEVIGAIGLVLTVAGAGFTLAPKVSAIFHYSGPPHLEIAEITVSNPTTVTASSGSGGSGSDPGREPTVSATVRNRGNETAWIEEARITIVAATRLPACLAQGGGDVPSTKRYPSYLPEFPGTDPETITRDLHAEVQPGSGVRPILGFRKSTFGDATNLYAIHVELIADPGHQSLDFGRFVISVPSPVSRHGETLPESDSVLRSPLAGSGSGDPLTTACFLHNLHGVRRVMAQAGRRSDDIAALAHLRVASTWKSYADHRPPRLLIPELLASEGPEAPLYAIEAARRTGDADYAAKIEGQAVALLLRLGREETDLRSAVQDAERALSIKSSKAAKHLLWRSQARGHAEEEGKEGDRSASG